MILRFFTLLFLCHSILFAQDSNAIEQELSINKNVDGILLTPKTEQPPLVIILSGSGPNDRNGNSNVVKGNLLKKLAEELATYGIASYRYDKRSSKYIKERSKEINNITFKMFIDDATASIDYFKSKNLFSKIYVLGHSQGSLIGMIAAKDKADGFISISGPSESIDKTIIKQVNASAPMFTPKTKELFDILRSGQTTDDYPPALASIFNKPTQPFIAEWMQYDPVIEVEKLSIPILVINGTNDFQVSEDNAKNIHVAGNNSKLVLIENMNHALVIYEGKDTLGNMKSYNEIKRSLSAELIKTLVSFIK